MKIILTKTGAELEVNDCYGARMIEQGKAIPAEKPKEQPVNNSAPANSGKKRKAVAECGAE